MSTLYYAVKIEDYLVYREHELNTHSKVQLEYEKSRKCILSNSKPELEIHLCLLNDYTTKRNLKQNICIRTYFILNLRLKLTKRNKSFLN